MTTDTLGAGTLAEPERSGVCCSRVLIPKGYDARDGLEVARMRTSAA